MTRHTNEEAGSKEINNRNTPVNAKRVTDGGEGKDITANSSEIDDPIPAPHGTPEELHQTSPLLRPTLALTGLVAVVAAIALIFLIENPETVGGEEFAKLVQYGIIIVALLLLIRLSITIVILLRTTYTIHEEGFRMEYKLGYHKKSREIPVKQLRGREHERSRFETMFNCATIRLLTGGTDRSLGFLEFVHIPDPETVDEKIKSVRRRFERHN